MNNKIFFDHQIIDPNKVNISLFTHALHYGTAVFEGCRAYNGKVFKLKEHNERLLNSGKLIDLPINYTLQELEEATYKVLEVNNLKNAYIRPLAFRGNDGATNLSVKSIKHPVHLMISAWIWDTYFGKEKIEAGIKLMATKYVRPDPRSTETQAKASGLYFIGSGMHNSCSRNGYDDVLMLDWQGNIAECAASNIFFIKDKELHTPIPDCFLNGITRQTVISLAKDLGYSVFERKITTQELKNFDEAFVTGTAIEVLPVASIFDTYIFKNRTHTNTIRNEYLDLVNQ